MSSSLACNMAISSAVAHEALLIRGSTSSLQVLLRRSSPPKRNEVVYR
jgi:hypothetical protein